MAYQGADLESVRRGVFIVYGAIFLWSIFAFGIPVDRLAVLTWMLVAFLISTIGRSKTEMTQTVKDWMILVFIYMIYDYSRGIADQLGVGVNFTLPRDIDRFFTRGTDPNVWMQDTFLQKHIRWYDVAGSIIYMMHFVLPVVPLTTLRIRNRIEWVRYVRRFSSTLIIAVSVFMVFPAAPPWMASEKGHIDQVFRITGRGWWALRLKTVSHTIDRGAAVLNAVAAMPSLHAGMSLLVALWYTRNKPTWMKRCALLYPFLMMLTLVYFGEHYISDCIAGFGVVLIAWFGSEKWEQRRARQQDSVAEFIN